MITDPEPITGSQCSYRCRDQQDDNAKRNEDLYHRQDLCPSCQQRRVRRPECGTLRKRNEQIIDKVWMPPGARKLGSFVVCNLHLWEKETLAAKFLLFVAQGWPTAIQTPVPEREHDDIR